MNIKLQKTILASLSLGVLLATMAGPIYAQDGTASATPRPGQVLRQEVKQEIQTTRGEIRTDRAQIHGDRLTNHFSFYQTRLTNIDKRIQSLIDKKKAAGKDTTAAQTQLDTAKATLAQAIIDGSNAISMFKAIAPGTWDVQKPDIKAAIAEAQLARKEFASARSQALQAVDILIKL